MCYSFRWRKKGRTHYPRTDMSCTRGGQYLQKILAYKFDSSAPKEEATYLLWEHSLQYPIHSLIAVDLTGDGVKDLSVLSMRGLHILQKDINKAAGLVSERLTDLQNSFKKLELIEADHSNESLPRPLN
ncbi:KPTN [Bugula neritina]|uniref:KPTN n=1 Tax=Bugula neritina TaxID=10212 RepID=A0A7J7JAN8_BUGNE|nr:KPTN [Bugula neritina]